MKYEPGDFHYDILCITLFLIQRDFNETMIWSSHSSFKEHFHKVLGTQDHGFAPITIQGFEFLLPYFMESPIYLKYTLENDLGVNSTTPAQGGQIFTKSGRPKI